MPRASWLIVLILLAAWPQRASALANPASVFCVHEVGPPVSRQQRTAIHKNPLETPCIRWLCL